MKYFKPLLNDGEFMESHPEIASVTDAYDGFSSSFGWNVWRADYLDLECTDRERILGKIQYTHEMLDSDVAELDQWMKENYQEFWTEITIELPPPPKEKPLTWQEKLKNFTLAFFAVSLLLVVIWPVIKRFRNSPAV